MDEKPADPQVWSVWQLTARIKDTLESLFPAVWVAGEISNLSRPQSGHLYFTLKDDRAQLRAVAWRSTASRLRFDLRDGMEVICCGAIDVYPPHGGYQLVVRQIEPRGEGALQLALRQLQQRLAAEGLFDAARKRPLPRYPRRIAFVTSPTGAAIRDFLEALARRWPAADVLVIPARVQGEGSAAEIVAGIRAAHRLRPRPDVLVVGRGGGSLEDLWSFNEEAVVRAIAACEIPTVSAVGHEIDVTLADLAADLRALTPTDAAQRVAPDAAELRDRLRGQQARAAAALRRHVVLARERLERVLLRTPLRRPLDAVRERSLALDQLRARLDRSAQRLLATRGEQLAALAGRLQSLSPLGVLARGYSLTQREADGQPVADAGMLKVGERIVTRFGRGRAASRVEEIEPDG